MKSEMELQLNKEVLQILPTKDNASKLAGEMILDIQNGWVDPFETLAKLEAIKIVCDQVRAGVEAQVRAELEKFGKEGKKVLDAKFELAEVGVKYDYSNDQIWCALHRQIQELVEQMKDQEVFLKAIKKPMNEADLNTGEMIERMPPTKTSKSSFKISLGK